MVHAHLSNRGEMKQEARHYVALGYNNDLPWVTCPNQCHIRVGIYV